MENTTLTTGQTLAVSFRPFISPGVKSLKDVDAVVVAMSKDIDRVINDAKTNNNIITRINQLLSALDYESLTDFQSKCVLLLERELK